MNSQRKSPKLLGPEALTLAIYLVAVYAVRDRALRSPPSPRERPKPQTTNRATNHLVRVLSHSLLAAPTFARWATTKAEPIQTPTWRKEISHGSQNT